METPAVEVETPSRAAAISGGALGMGVCCTTEAKATPGIQRAPGGEGGPDGVRGSGRMGESDSSEPLPPTAAARISSSVTSSESTLRAAGLAAVGLAAPGLPAGLEAVELR